MSDETFVYVIGYENGPVKVGVSAYPHGRLRTLQAGSPYTLHLFFAIKCNSRVQAMKHEADALAVYEDKRLNGEWLDIDEELAQEAIETSIELDSPEFHAFMESRCSHSA